MHATPRYPPAARVSAGALTLLVHGLFALLMLLEESAPDRPLPAARRLMSLWIHLPLPEGLPAVEDAGAGASQPVDVSPEEAPVRAPPARASTITLPTASTAPSTPAAPVAPPDTPVDWFSQAGTLAARAAEAAETEPSFSAPADKMREPCKPRKSSFEWKDKPPKPEPQINPLLPPTDSVKLGGARVGVVGIGIKLFGPKDEPNKHLFDDMKAGKTPYSSVPDPNYCD
jgi:hypothetical protein